MIFPRKIKTFLSSIAAFFFPRCPELYQQEEPPSLPQPATAAGIDIEGQPSSSLQPQLSSQLETLAAVQNHQQWQNAVISFCFSYALGVSLQYAETPHQSNQHLPFPMVLLSFLVLLTFICILGAFFIDPYCTTTSNALQKVGHLLAAAAFTHTLSIPLPFELKCTIWAVFLLPLLTAIILSYFNTKTA
ncbi:hypothetical protein ES319_A09G096000v1 [Gossypium barbadense]|uniref:Transmembrane protein n=2 Tax=Gossypium TaxID=3633 RepID=A0A5J5UCS6_GOSBA|nr:hypothetical protein ES319_A09G096000v1 [Gossypium barbadense]TYH02142.1 hypothetical protein ES288_A09G115000v1 [Gossypium darwinii]